MHLVVGNFAWFFNWGFGGSSKTSHVVAHQVISLFEGGYKNKKKLTVKFNCLTLTCRHFGTD